MNPTKMKVILFWLMVVVPLGWGVMQSVKKAMPLFQGSAAAGKP
jgi:hypothetical protein